MSDSLNSKSYPCSQGCCLRQHCFFFKTTPHLLLRKISVKLVSNSVIQKLRDFCVLCVLEPFTPFTISCRNYLSRCFQRGYKFFRPCSEMLCKQDRILKVRHQKEKLPRLRYVPQASSACLGRESPSVEKPLSWRRSRFGVLRHRRSFCSEYSGNAGDAGCVHATPAR